MCGRYALFSSSGRLVEQFGIQRNELGELTPRYNIAPYSTVPIIRIHEGARVLSGAHWGLIPSWAKKKQTGFSMFNARAETVLDKPSFKSSFYRRRCIVPADGWYEWTSDHGVKRPSYFYLDGTLAAFAGFWTWHEKLEVLSCTIIVTNASSKASLVHDRMPVLLPHDDIDAYLSAETPIGVVMDMLQPCEADNLQTRPVSQYVNQASNEGERCIAPIGELPDH